MLENRERGDLIIQNFICQQMTSGNINYLPFENALILEGQDEENELKKELEQLQKNVGDRFNNIVHRFDTIEVWNRMYKLIRFDSKKQQHTLAILLPVQLCILIMTFF